MNISTMTFNNIGPVLMLKLSGWSGVFVILFLVSCVYFLISSFAFTNHSNGHQLAFLFLPTNVYFPLVQAGLSQHLLLPSRMSRPPIFTEKTRLGQRTCSLPLCTMGLEMIPNPHDYNPVIMSITKWLNSQICEFLSKKSNCEPG